MNTGQVVDFRSDNVAPAAEEVIRALAVIGRDAASSYGEDHETQHLAALFSEVFNQAAVGWPVPAGTAANAMTIAGLLPEGGAVVCHEWAHGRTTQGEHAARSHSGPLAGHYAVA